MSTQLDLAATISNLPNAQFASFLYRSKGDNKLARVTVILGASTEKLYEKDIAVLNLMLQEETDPTWRKAILEILDSRTESLAKGIGNNSKYTCAGAYIFPPALEGVKICISDASLHVVGLLQQETVLEPGIVKPDTRGAFTKMKDAVRSKLPSAKFRQYRIARVQSARVAGEVLEIENAEV